MGWTRVALPLHEQSILIIGSQNDGQLWFFGARAFQETFDSACYSNNYILHFKGKEHVNLANHGTATDMQLRSRKGKQTFQNFKFELFEFKNIMLKLMIICRSWLSPFQDGALLEIHNRIRIRNRKLTRDQSTFTFTLQFEKVSLVQPGFNSPLEMGYLNPGFPRIACVLINIGCTQVKPGLNPG